MRMFQRSSLGLYLVIGAAPNQHGVAPLHIAEAALAGGITMLQWREKALPLQQSMALAAQIRERCRAYEVPFIVNDRVDVALCLAADGVHLGQDDLPLPAARQLLGPEVIIGISTGTLAEAASAQSAGADYVGVGAIYATSTKADAGAPIGTSLVAEIARELAMPQVGIGGITEHNAAAVIQAGADGVAVISAITQATDVRMAAARLRAIVCERS